MADIKKFSRVAVEKLKPYKNNAKEHSEDQISKIAASISEFGFLSPVLIDKEFNIIAGHGRVMAAKLNGLSEVPCAFIEGLTEEQRKAYVLIDNRLSELGTWDKALMESEIAGLLAADFDVEQFGLEVPNVDDLEEPEAEENELEPPLRHNVFENQEKRQYVTENWYGIPEMQPTQITGDKLLRFCDFNQIEDHENYIAHFYYDDFKFISAWREPDKYVEKLKQFKAVISPDFSLYTDFPRALQILSCYRRQWCGAYWQEQGLTVIPDVVWGDEESYKFCFLGIPKHSTVAVSNVGVTLDEDWNDKKDSLFRKGYAEMMERLQPTTVIFYGSEIDGLEGNIIRCPSFYEERRILLPNGRSEDGQGDE